MATFSAWWLAYAKDETVRQITWLCGTEPVLIAEVLTSITKSLGVHPWNYTALDAEDMSERTIWTEVDRLPVDGSFRLVVVRHAQLLKHWDRWDDWLAKRNENPKTYVVFISDEERVATVPGATKHDRPTTAPHIATFSRRGHVVECRPFTTATAKHAVSWVQSKVRMPTNVAGHLLNRSNGDMRLVRDMTIKLAVLSDSPTIPMVNLLLSEQPREQFEDALMERNKNFALLALERMPVEEYSRVIGRLDASLDLAGIIYDMTSAHAHPGEIARAVGNRAFLVPALTPVAKHYGERRRQELRGLLAAADEAIQGGATEGVMEALTALW